MKEIIILKMSDFTTLSKMTQASWSKNNFAKIKIPIKVGNIITSLCFHALLSTISFCIFLNYVPISVYAYNSRTNFISFVR